MSLQRAKRTTEDPLKQLSPLAACEIVKAARASLKEPTRPVTPADAGRRLLQAQGYANRPQTPAGQISSREFVHGGDCAAGNHAPWNISTNSTAERADIWKAKEIPSARPGSALRPAGPAADACSGCALNAAVPADTQAVNRPLSASMAMPAMPAGTSSRRPPAGQLASLLKPCSVGAGAAASAAPCLLGGSSARQPIGSRSSQTTNPTASACTIRAASTSEALKRNAATTAAASTVPAAKQSPTPTSSSSSSTIAEDMQCCMEVSRCSISSGHDTSRGSSRGSSTSSSDEALADVSGSPTLSNAAAAGMASAWQRNTVQVVGRINALPISPLAADTSALLQSCAALQTLLDTAEDQQCLQDWLLLPARPAPTAATAEQQLPSSVDGMGMQDLIVGALVRLVDCPTADVLIKVGSMLLRVLPVPGSMMATTAKMLYRLSKDSSNDTRFRHHGVIRPLLSVVSQLSAASRNTAQPFAEGSRQLRQQSHGALLYFNGCLKNISADSTNQKTLGRLGAVAILSMVLMDQLAMVQEQTAAGQHQKLQSEAAAQVCVQITAVLRNLAVYPNHAALFVQQQGLPLKALLQLVMVFECHDEVLLNVSRCLSKLSLHSDCRTSMMQLHLQQQSRPITCDTTVQQQHSISSTVHCLVQLLVRPQSAHCSQWPLVLRVTFVLGNLTTFHPEARADIAQLPGALDGLLQLALHILHQQQNSAESRHLQEKQRTSDSDAVAVASSGSQVAAEDLLVKLLRLLGNVAIDQSAGPALASNAAAVQLIIGVLHSYDFEQQQELVLNAAAALTNLAFYNQVDNMLFEQTTDLLLQPLLPMLTGYNEEAVIEATRAISNLLRGAEAVQAALLSCAGCSSGSPEAISTSEDLCIVAGSSAAAAGHDSTGAAEHRTGAASGSGIGSYLLQALVLLLMHSSWEVVYNAAGALLNLTTAADAAERLSQVQLGKELQDVVQRLLDEVGSSTTSRDGQDSSIMTLDDNTQRLQAAEVVLQCLCNMAACAQAQSQAQAGHGSLGIEQWEGLDQLINALAAALRIRCGVGDSYSGLLSLVDLLQQRLPPAGAGGQLTSSKAGV